MKVLIVATEVGETNGGKGRYTHNILRGLVPQLRCIGCQVTILVPKDAPSGSFRVGCSRRALAGPQEHGHVESHLGGDLYSP